MDTRRRNPIIIVSFLVVLFVILAVVNFVSQADKTAKLEIEVAPSDATIILNQSKTRGGKRRIEPGKYTVTVSRAGFAVQSKEVTLKDGSDEYVGIALESNSPSTKDWYSEHPKDLKIAERITSINFDQQSEKNTDPILGSLPFVGPGETYQIDYSATDSNGKVSVVVSYVNEEAKQDAVNWFSNNNFDITKYNVTYTDLLASESLGE